MERKVLGMKNSMGITLEQLRQSTKLLAQYRVKMQTLKIRIQIEEKVKATYESAKFEERYKLLEQQFATSQKRQESLKVEIETIQNSWADYYAMAIEDIKTRFSEIDKGSVM